MLSLSFLPCLCVCWSMPLCCMFYVSYCLFSPCPCCGCTCCGCTCYASLFVLCLCLENSLTGKVFSGGGIVTGCLVLASHVSTGLGGCLVGSDRTWPFQCVAFFSFHISTILSYKHSFLIIAHLHPGLWGQASLGIPCYTPIFWKKGGV